MKQNKRISVYVLLLVLFWPLFSRAEIYKVGDAWGSAKSYSTLQELIDAGAGKASTDEIWIAGDQVLTKAWVISTWQGKIYGGFSGTETSVDQRPLKSGGRGWDFEYPTTLRLAEKTEDEQNSLIWSYAYTNNGAVVTLIDGLWFDGTNCTATPLWFRQFSSSGVTVRNCVVENASLATDNVLNPGTTDFIAGGIQFGSDDASNVNNVVIEECLVRNCRGRVGGIVARNTTIKNCVVMNNTGVDTDKSGGVYAYGATSVTNSIFYNNTLGGVVNNATVNNTTLTWSASNNVTNTYSSLFLESAGNITETDSTAIFSPKTITVNAPDDVSLSEIPESVTPGTNIFFTVTAPENKKIEVTVGGKEITSDAAGIYSIFVLTNTTINVTTEDRAVYVPVKATTDSIDWANFLSIHDMYWTSLTTDPTSVSADNSLKTGYYAGALMGNGLLGTNLYKLKANVYRLNAGRSDVTEIRKPYDLYNSARLPIGYFTLSTVGNVTGEKMRLSLYDAETQGTFTTDQGQINFKTYVHANKNYIIFETNTTGAENNYVWDFVPQQAISPRQLFSGGAPSDYLNSAGKSNPDVITRVDGDYHLAIQPLAIDSSFETIGKVYVVAWKAVTDGNARRIIATIAQEDTQEAAVASAKAVIDSAFAETSASLEASHKAWWHDFYKHAAFLTFPTTKYESFYWSQYYKFASTTRPGKPIVDLQGVWPTWDTPWTAVWINLNLQLTYSWQTKANLGFLSESLWESLYEHKDNLQRNVTDISSQSTWTDAACLGRTSTYDFLAPLDPALVSKNQYEVGNLTWLLYYYWQHCVAYGDTVDLKTKLFPLLKSAVNLYFHIRTTSNGKYGLPSTASPEYVSTEIGPNTNYDLSNLRWGLKTLIDIDTTYQMQDDMLDQWVDFYTNLVDYPYSSTTGYKVSDTREFTDTSHRHYSHLFMIYPYHLVDWEDPTDGPKMELSVSQWNGNQGYSRTGKAAMLASKGDGDGALSQMDIFFSSFLKPNTLYAETGPVIETPMAAMSTLHEFYLQDWGNKIRVFFGLPTTWTEASFMNMRAKGAFLVSATRKSGKTVFIQVESERGGLCRLQTGMTTTNLELKDLSGNDVPYDVVDAKTGVIEVHTQPGDIFQVIDNTLDVELPAPIDHPIEEGFSFGDGAHSVPLVSMSFSDHDVVIDNTNMYVSTLVTQPEGAATGTLTWTSGDETILKNNNGIFSVLSDGNTWIAFISADGMFTDTCRVEVRNTGYSKYIILPEADSYVYDGSSGQTVNYGTEATVIVKKDNSGYQRKAYFKFPIEDISSLPSGAKVLASLFVASTGSAANSVNWQLYACGTDWTETGIAWNNKPATTTLIAEAPGFNNESGVYAEDYRVDFDITDYVTAQKAAGASSIAFAVDQSARATGGGGMTYFASKENANSLEWPYLIVTDADIVTSIPAAAIDRATPVRYYNLQGQPVSGNRQPGIYIVKGNGTVQKILVK